jgi:hypothetical protein
MQHDSGATIWKLILLHLLHEIHNCDISVSYTPHSSKLPLTKVTIQAKSQVQCWTCSNLVFSSLAFLSLYVYRYDSP